MSFFDKLFLFQNNFGVCVTLMFVYFLGAALGTPYFTAARAMMQRGRAKPGETVLVHGASGAVSTSFHNFSHL